VNTEELEQRLLEDMDKQLSPRIAKRQEKIREKQDKLRQIYGDDLFLQRGQNVSEQILRKRIQKIKANMCISATLEDLTITNQRILGIAKEEGLDVQEVRRYVLQPNTEEIFETKQYVRIYGDKGKYYIC